MKQLDPEDGLAIWDFTEGSDLPGGNLAIERLGIGGSSETWLAWNPGLWSPAVLKLARPHEIRRQRARQALRRETAALAGNLHPGLPRLLADGTNDPIPHILIEYIDGPALDEQLDHNGAIAAEETALLGAQLLPALTSLHHRGLAHLDLKSANIALRDGHPILLDFDTVAPIGTTQDPGHPVGTEGYCAPEQEACKPITLAMDLYGLGMILAEAVTGLPCPQAAEIPPSPLAPLIHQLRSEQPAQRGTTADILIALANAAGELRPWPTWLDHYATDSQPRSLTGL